MLTICLTWTILRAGSSGAATPSDEAVVPLLISLVAIFVAAIDGMLLAWRWRRSQAALTLPLPTERVTPVN